MAEKKTLSAKGVVADIRSGFSDDEIMKKYGLSSKGLQSVLAKLQQAKLLSTEEYNRRVAPLERPLEPVAEGEKRVSEQPPESVKILRELAERFKFSKQDVERLKTASLNDIKHLAEKYNISLSESKELLKILGISAGSLLTHAATKLKDGTRKFSEEFHQTQHIGQKEEPTPIQSDSPPMAPSQTLFKCPACHMPQDKEFDICPQCGVIVEKFIKKNKEQKIRRAFRIAGGIFSVIGGILATGVAAFTLYFGTFDSGWIGALSETETFRWIGPLLAFLTIFLGAMAIRVNSTMLGIMLIVSSLIGAVGSSMFIAICLALPFVGGILCFIGARASKKKGKGTPIRELFSFRSVLRPDLPLWERFEPLIIAGVSVMGSWFVGRWFILSWNWFAVFILFIGTAIFVCTRTLTQTRRISPRYFAIAGAALLMLNVVSVAVDQTLRPRWFQETATTDSAPPRAVSSSNDIEIPLTQIQRLIENQYGTPIYTGVKDPRGGYNVALVKLAKIKIVKAKKGKIFPGEGTPLRELMDEGIRGIYCVSFACQIMAATGSGFFSRDNFEDEGFMNQMKQQISTDMLRESGVGKFSIIVYVYRSGDMKLTNISGDERVAGRNKCSDSWLKSCPFSCQN